MKLLTNRPSPGLHAGAVCVEYPGDPDIDGVLAMVLNEEGLGAPLAFIVACPPADGIYPSPVGFLLRVRFGIAVNLAGGRLQYPGIHAPGEPEEVYGAYNVCLDGLDGIGLVMNR